ncbi:globin-like protein, partial [Rozella allomycis CSF55]
MDTDQPNLYDSAGHNLEIEKVVEILYELILADENLKDTFKDINIDRQRRMMSKFISNCVDGKKYNQKYMRNSHSKLNLTEKHFETVMDHLITAMQRVGVSSAL